MMRLLLVLNVFFCFALQSQNSTRFCWGIAYNRGYGQMVPDNVHVKAATKAKAGYYLNIGVEKMKDSIYSFYLGMRFGRENALMRLTGNGTNLPQNYIFVGRSLGIIFSPGIRLRKKQRLCLITGVALDLPLNEGGSAEGGGTFGEYSYIITHNEPLNALEPRIGLGWQLKPFVKRKTVFEVSIETTTLTRQVKLTDGNGNFLPNQQALNYYLTLLQFGIRF